MGLLGDLWKRFEDFSNSEDGKRMAEDIRKFNQRLEQKAAERRAEEIRRTTGKNGLRCNIDSCNNSGGNVVCQGKVSNIGRSTYNKVVIEVVYRNSNGQVVDRKQEYIWSTLYPGESRPFVSVSYARDAHRVNISIAECREI